MIRKNRIKMAYLAPSFHWDISMRILKLNVKRAPD